MKEQRVPTVGESITEVTIANWNKKSGDFVKKDEVLCELESDKATFEVSAEADGILEVVANEGDTIPIGGVICRIAPAAAGAGTTPAAPAAPVAEAPKAQAPAATATGQIVDMVVPTVGESISEVTIGSWSKKDGEAVKNGELLCEIESDKATFELVAEKTGILRIVAQAGTVLPIGGLICKIEVTDGASATASAPVAAAPVSTPAAGDSSYASGHPSPAASKILAEKGLEASQVQGSGVGGRITKEDAEKAAMPKAEAPKTSAPATAAPAAKPASGNRQQNRQRMSSMRRTIARRLVSVKNETAMLTTFNEVDMQPIKDIRAKYKDKFKEKHNVNLGFMSFFVKACCMALQEFPAVNAYIDGDDIIYNDFCDISIAVSTEKGLVVPVIRNAEQMSLDEIEKEIINLAKKARDGKLTIPDMTGGTFTITNGGIFGSMLSTPIINAPQSAILGMHNIVDRPVAINGKVEIRPIMYVALSYDHRIIDGKDSVSYLFRVKELLEDPIRLMLGV